MENLEKVKQVTQNVTKDLKVEVYDFLLHLSTNVFQSVKLKASPENELDIREQLGFSQIEWGDKEKKW